MGSIQNALYFLQTDARIFNVMPHPVGVGLESLDGEFRPDRAKREIVLKKIVVAVNVGNRQNLQSQGIVAHEIGDAGIGVDHHLIGQPAQAIIVKRFEFFVGLTVGPVWVMGGHPGINHVGEHLLIITDLELLRVGIQAEPLNQLDDPLIPFLQIFNGVICGHNGSG